MKLEVIKDAQLKETLIKIYTAQIDLQTQEIIDFIEKKPYFIYGYKNKRLEFIKTENIIRIFTENKHVFIQTLTDTYLAKQRIFYFEQHLNSNFIQISQGEIINIKYIKQLDLTIKGSIEVTLKNGFVSFVSRRSLKRFKEKLKI